VNSTWKDESFCQSGNLLPFMKPGGSLLHSQLPSARWVQCTLSKKTHFKPTFLISIPLSFSLSLRSKYCLQHPVSWQSQCLFRLKDHYTHT
jgi:hypothetical protein